MALSELFAIVDTFNGSICQLKLELMLKEKSYQGTAEDTAMAAVKQAKSSILECVGIWRALFESLPHMFTDKVWLTTF